MFSNILQRLRLEAKKVSPTNAQLLARFHEHDKYDMHRRASGDCLQSAVERTSAGLGVGGLIGLTAMSTAIGAAQTTAAAAAAGVSASSLQIALASAGTALGHLGTVAIAGAALPAAPVIALGVAAAGAAGLLISRIMPTSEERGRDATMFAEQNLTAAAARNPHGHDKLSAMAWLQGAKNLIANSIRGHYSSPSVLAATETTSYLSPAVAEQLAKIDALPDKDARLAHMKAIQLVDQNLFSGVMDALRQRKEETVKVGPKDFLQALGDADAASARARAPSMRGG